jgi:AcrR family transcriptional regulator
MSDQTTSKTQKQIQSEQTRQRIIQAATRLFARKGFYGTSIAHLAQAVGLTKGALYHHFENKDAIFFAVIASARDDWNREVARDVVQGEDAITRLSILLDEHTRRLDENDMLCLVLSSLMAEMEDANPGYATVIQEMYAELIGFIERIVQKGQAAGEIRSDLDARLLASSIVGVLRGIGCYPVLGQVGADRMAMTEMLKQMLFEGLRP